MTKIESRQAEVCLQQIVVQVLQKFERNVEIFKIYLIALSVDRQMVELHYKCFGPHTQTSSWYIKNRPLKDESDVSTS